MTSASIRIEQNTDSRRKESLEDKSLKSLLSVSVAVSLFVVRVVRACAAHCHNA